MISIGFSLKTVVLTLSLLLVTWISLAADESPKKTLFLPKSPVAAAYVLARLSDKELIEAPRSEFVYVALIQRAGLDRKYRLEALDGLAKIRGTDTLSELIVALSDLDQKGEESIPVLRELIVLLVQYPSADLTRKRGNLETLATQSQLPLGRQAGYAALLTSDRAIQSIRQSVELDSAKYADLILSVPLLRDPALRVGFYSILQPLLTKIDEDQLRRAAITAIVAVPGHESEVFTALVTLVKAGIERALTVDAIQRIPRKFWLKEQAESLFAHLMTSLKEMPDDQRTGPEATSQFQLASDLLLLLPQESSKEAAKALRAVGVSVFVLRTVHEQMIYDKTLLVVEAGKPVEIILMNEDTMPHNLVIVPLGSAELIGKAAEKMGTEADAQGRIYVPDSDKIFQATKMIEAGQQGKLSFMAPSEPGEYTYLCTFPGHSIRMQGTLVIVKDVEAYLASRPLIAEPKVTEWTLSDFTGLLDKPSATRNLLGGKENFTKLACIQCHKLGQEGAAYGPELTDVLKRMKMDRASLLTEILEPSKIIGDRYKNYSFELTNGDELAGMIMKEDAESLTVHTGPSDALIQTLKKTQIKKREPQTSSLMPMGLLNFLSKEQVLDLLGYIEAGGKLSDQTHAH